MNRTDYCPACHVPGATYYGDWNPIGRVVAKKSGPVGGRVWVECPQCGLRTAGSRTEAQAVKLWNCRANKHEIANLRWELIRTAKITLSQLNHRAEDSIPQPSGLWVSMIEE